MRRSLWWFGLALVSGGSSRAQDTFLTLSGPVGGGRFGERVVGLPDVTGDGVPEVAVGSPSWTGAAGNKTGIVWVFSGLDGSLLWQKEGLGKKDGLGGALASPGDLDGDGQPELVLGVGGDDTGGKNAGALWVVDGANGAIEATFLGSSAGARLGSSVAAAADLDGDGVRELLVRSDLSQVTVLSGATLAVLYQWSSNPMNFLGLDLAGLGDVDGDGVGDLLLGSGGGYAVVRSGANGTVIRSHQGPPTAFFGTVVADAGDVNADGRADYAVGAPFYTDQQTVGFFKGRAYVYSGLDGTLLHLFEGASYERLGSTLAAAGDLDGDGADDIVVGSLPDPGGLVDVGRLEAWSGATGALISSIQGSTSGEMLGTAADGSLDLDGDGVRDLIVGAPGADTAAGAAAGRVLLVSAATACTFWCASFCDCSAGGACGNSAQQSGCPNSTGAGARLYPRGVPSQSADTLWLHATGLPPGRAALLLLATGTTAPLPFGDGILCLGPASPAGLRLASPGGAATWGPGGIVTWPLGQSSHAQVVYRDPSGPCAQGFNATQAVLITAAP